MNMTSIAQFIYLFFLLCLAFVLFFVFFNIQSKSYRPRKAFIFNIIILFLFVVNGIAGFYSVNRLFDNISKNIESIKPGTDNNQNKTVPSNNF